MTCKGLLRPGLFVAVCLGGCHLIGGAGDLEFGPAASGEGGAATTTASSMPGTGGNVGGSGGQGGGGAPGMCGDGVVEVGELCFSGVPQEIATVGLPFDMVGVDCDDDSRTDLVVVGKQSNSTSDTVLQVFQNDGAWTASGEIPLGSTLTQAPPAAMVTGDFIGGSGGRDLAITIREHDSAAAGLYLVGHGANCSYATSVAPAVLPSNTNPIGLVAAKVDADGLDDLVVTVENGDPTDLWIYRSDQGTTTSPSVAMMPTRIAAGHFDAVPNVDVAYVDTTDHKVLVRLGSTNQNFFSPEIVPVPGWPIDVAVGDMDGDGDVDIVVASMQANSVSVLRNDGHGAFTADAPVSVEGTGPFRLVVTDLDGDGDLDVVTANAGGQQGVFFSVSLLVNQGDGTLVLAQEPSAIDDAPGAMVVADFNGDGAKDIALLVKTANDAGAVLLWTADP